MIKFENTVTPSPEQWEAVIMGARNPLNSWHRYDSGCVVEEIDVNGDKLLGEFKIGPNDYDLMKRLCKAGTDHRKFMRMLPVMVTITAPLYWWKEFDTYKVSTVANSCSTMHKIHAKEFNIDDFSYEHLMHAAVVTLGHTIDDLNQSRRVYLYGGELCDRHGNWTHFEPKDKRVWWQMIQLLPSSYNQKRTVMLNYEVLANIYKSRKNHKLDEWRDFCDWICGLTYGMLITGEFEEN